MEPQPSPFDLNFRLFGIPIRVAGSFWLFALAFSYLSVWIPGVPFRFGLFFVSIFCLFFSILVHELGHAVTMRIFRLPARIVLLAMGGLAISPFPANHRWKRIAICLAGPAAGIGLLYLPIYFNQRAIEKRFLATDYEVLVEHAVQTMLFFTGFWNIVNLLPVYPLDGGQATLEVVNGISNRKGPVIAFGIGFVTAALVILISLPLVMTEHAWKESVQNWLPESLRNFSPIFMVGLFAMLALQNYSLMRKAESSPNPWD